jgi:hypothetical protein
MATHPIRSKSHRRRLLAQGSPFLYLDGVNDNIGFGSDASIDDLPAGDCTVELWMTAASSAVLRTLSKYNTAPRGWELRVHVGNMRVMIAFDTTAIGFNSSIAHSLSTWFHAAFTYDAATKTATVWINGQNGGSGVGVGSYVSDAPDNLNTAYGGVLNRHHGNIGWVRLSNVKRYTGAFTPPARDAPPAVDGNTVEQWNMDEGEGTTAAAQVTSPTNDATITGATWMEG